MIKNLIKNLAADVQSLLYRFGLIADYVIEQGTSDDWIYRKWQSGVLECEANLTLRGSWTQWSGSTIYALFGRYLYPIEFYDIPTVFMSPNIARTNSSSSSWAGAYTSVSESEAKKLISIALYRATSGSSTETYYVSVKAKGLWKALNS